MPQPVRAQRAAVDPQSSQPRMDHAGHDIRSDRQMRSEAPEKHSGAVRGRPLVADVVGQRPGHAGRQRVADAPPALVRLERDPALPPVDVGQLQQGDLTSSHAVRCQDYDNRPIPGRNIRLRHGLEQAHRVVGAQPAWNRSQPPRIQRRDRIDQPIVTPAPCGGEAQEGAHRRFRPRLGRARRGRRTGTTATAHRAASGGRGDHTGMPRRSTGYRAPPLRPGRRGPRSEVGRIDRAADP